MMNRAKYNRFFSGAIGKKPRTTIYNHSKKRRLIETINRHNDDQIDHGYNLNESNPTIPIEIETENINNGEVLINPFNVERGEFTYTENLDDFSDLDPNEKKKYICFSLLSLFYAGNFTQTGLELIVRHLQHFLDFKIPKTFDQLVLRLEPKNIEFKKKWFCPKCQSEVVLDWHYQRECHNCDEKTKFLFLLNFICILNS